MIEKTLHTGNFIFLIFLLCSASLSGQHWNPVYPGRIYHYVLNDSLNQNYTHHINTSTDIRVDSISTSFGDTVYFLNRVIPFFSRKNPPTVLHKDQQQFLQQSISKKQAGLFVLSGEDSLYIHSRAEIGEPWTFSPRQGITAFLSHYAYQEIWGEMDSVQFIILSTGDTISLSKSHGILRFPFELSGQFHFSLAGTTHPNLGKRPPGFYDFYQFSPGDRFEYRTDIYLPYNNIDIREQISILERIDTTGGIAYRIKGIRKYLSVDTHFPDQRNPVFTAFNDSVWYIPYDQKADLLNDEAYIFSPSHQTYHPHRLRNISFCDQTYAGREISSGYGEYSLDTSVGPHALVCEDCGDIPQNYQVQQYAAGLGKVYEQQGFGPFLKQLTAFSIANGQCGTFSSLENEKQQQEIESSLDQAFRIFPHPVNDRSTLLIDPSYGAGTIHFINLRGQVIKEMHYPPKGLSLYKEDFPLHTGLLIFIYTNEQGKKLVGKIALN